MSQKWIYKPEPDEEIVDGLISSIGFGTLESKILVMREIDNYQKAREFFKPNGADIHNPFLMADMQKAVERIATAIENGEKILVYGDSKAIARENRFFFINKINREANLYK